MGDSLHKLLLDNDSDDEESEPPQGGAVSASHDNAPDDEFYRQLAAVNALAPPRATPEPPANNAQAAGAQQQPVTSPPASKAMLILDPADVLAQQQRAAANRIPPMSQAASAGANGAAAASKPQPQQVTQMPGHAGGMMYRPVASAAPTQPAASMPQVNGTGKVVGAGPFAYFQQLLAFADQRWKDTNQLQKRHAARALVAQSKQDRGRSSHLPQEITRLVGDELVHEFKLTNGGAGPGTVRSQAPASVAHQQQPTPGTHQLPGIPPTAASLQQGPAAMAAAHQQQTMMQGKPNHAPGMARPSGPTLAGPPSHPMPQGAIKHEGLQPGLAQGQAPMRAPSPPVRAMSPAAPAGFTQAQLLQQQQAALQHAHQLPGSRPGSAKRPASAPVPAPAAKRQATKQEDEDVMDVLQNAGVNEEDEREALFGRTQPPSSRGPAPAAPQPLNPHPLQIKVQEALRQYNIQGVHPSLVAYLNQAGWLHMESLLTQASKMASQRADLSRKQEGMQMTSDVRKALGEKTKLEREKATAKEEAERKALLEASKTKDKDGDENVQRKVKEAQKEELERQNRAQTNHALGAALGGGARWQKWKAGGKAAGAGAAKAPAAEASAAPAAAVKAETKTAGISLAERAAARPQASQNPPSAASSSALPGASRSMLPSSRLVPEGQIVGLKDLIAVMEQHPIYCKSDHLYQLYERLDGP